MKYGSNKGYSGEGHGKVKSNGTPTAGNKVGVSGDNKAKTGDMGYVDKGMMNAMGTVPINKDCPTSAAPKPNAMAGDKKIHVSGNSEYAKSGNHGYAK